MSVQAVPISLQRKLFRVAWRGFVARSMTNLQLALSRARLNRMRLDRSKEAGP